MSSFTDKKVSIYRQQMWCSTDFWCNTNAWCGVPIDNTIYANKIIRNGRILNNKTVSRRRVQMWCDTDFWCDTDAWCGQSVNNSGITDIKICVIPATPNYLLSEEGDNLIAENDDIILYN